MKIKTLIKALYYDNPARFGFDKDYPYTVEKIYNDVVKHTKVDNCKRIHLNTSSHEYIKLYMETIKDHVLDYNNATKQEFKPEGVALFSKKG